MVRVVLPSTQNFKALYLLVFFIVCMSITKDARINASIKEVPLYASILIFYYLIHPSIHSPIYSFTHSFTHSFIHPFIQPFIHLFFHPFIHPFIHPVIRPFIHSFIHPAIHQSISQSETGKFKCVHCFIVKVTR